MTARSSIRGAALGLLMAAAPAGAAEPLPVELYAAIPLATDVRLSPDGERLALIGSREGRDVLIVHALKGGDTLVRLGPFEANWVHWKSPSRLVAGVRISTRGLALEQRDALEATRLYAVDADGGNPKSIGEPVDGFAIGDFRSKDRIHPQFQDEIASFLDDDPHHLLQTVLDSVPYRNNLSTPSVYRVDVDTGERQRVEPPRPFKWSYGADAAGTIRLAESESGTDRMVEVRDSADGDWRIVHRRNVNRDPAFHPLAFVPDAPAMLYVMGGDSAGHAGLWAFDTARGAFDHLVDGGIDAGKPPLVRGDRLVGYATVDGTMKYLDPAWQHDAQAIARALPGRGITLIDRTPDGKRVLIEATERGAPAGWWMLDRGVTPAQLALVIQTYPEIAAAGVAPVTRTSYTARDGLTIPARLTLPRGAAGPLPFVVLPHGGPHACDDDGFDFVAQFLASRGYGVLQPEFRGSTCVGPAFEQRGYREWGFAMQDDVTDGTRWLVDRKLADPGRICIAGMSYGGYAALEGAAKEPELYRCAAAWAPVSDLHRLIRDIRETSNHDAAVDRIGTDPDRLDAASPALHADRIRVPVLLVHGRSDFTVPVAHSEQMEAALKAAGKQVEAIYIDDSDHYLRRQAARLAWLKALERFLAANLGSAAAKL